MDTFDMDESTYPEFPDDSTTVNSPGSSEATPQPEQTEQPGKKKRKAWGQPIPDFKVVLPPRKRAKTAEEKEQRKNERVIRNRKAADKSRQRQKAAVAELEVKTGRMEAELARLRAALNQYQTTYGVLPGTSPVDFSECDLDSIPGPSPAIAHSTQNTIPTTETPNDQNSSDLCVPYPSPDDTTSYSATPGPTLSVDSPRPSISNTQSPPLAPSIFAAHDLPPFPTLTKDDALLATTTSNEISGLTQYPAAILCDPQCQPEITLDSVISQEATKQFNLQLYLVNLTCLITIYETFSDTMLLPMCQMFQTLAESFSTHSLTLDWMDRHFYLIHSLITTRSSKTTRPIFRMKLLSRLLACSPSTARLLKAATDRALQRLVDGEAILDGSEGGRQWASLLATKWAIQRLEKEHQRYRLVVDGPKYSKDRPVPELVRQMGLIKKMDGVDYVAVERSLWRWRSDNSLVGAV